MLSLPLALAAAATVLPSPELEISRAFQRAQAEVQAIRRDESRDPDRWKFPSEGGRNNLFFWEFKYFSFRGETVSGNIAFFTVAPFWSGKMIALAHIYSNGEMQSYRKIVDLNCVKGSPRSASLTLCGGDGIEALAPDRYRLTLKVGGVQWLLEFASTGGPGRLHRTPLDGRLVWEMFWQPVFIRGSVSGTIQSGREKVMLSGAPAYHDQNWGRWNPAKHPYRWLRFSGVDSEGEEVDLLLADFFENSSDHSSALILLRQGSSRTFKRGQYDFKVDSWGRAPTLRFSLYDEGENVEIRKVDSSFTTGDHNFPTAFSLKTKDHSLELTATTLVNAATGPDIPVIWKGLFKDFIIDLQQARVTLRFQDKSGKVRHAQGFAEFQTVTRPD
ncbi:MAG: hypothetical protein HY549_00210 [Elusimicrobia bacterium]|nr:hypothetical protein [Elusimicrobiota bacterium]